ncbi:helix-turn-helix domain-containing protein [Streptomyces sp. NBC_00237]|uniref:helix-turn-helix domain-containing protein n=1 Tax=Streptomyces sp. NBC_00237 TaxID=2975687 RepID=UPI0022516805|nr:helix-turn-helix domain-containing protein [Streptomyces sp. NBC_00237]MCX5202405.1 helix-turn-helix domain-containing protein [Streptomyces sp. NBC_00237]
MSRDWVRLAKAIEAAREANGYTQVTLAEAAGVSESTIQNLESGVERKRIPPSLAKVERALRWRGGSGESVLNGGEPTPAIDGQSIPPTELSGSGLPLRIIHELTSGPLLDTTVIQLGTDSRMVIVVKGQPDASPDQLRADVIAWAKAQELLEGIGGAEGSAGSVN